MTIRDAIKDATKFTEDKMDELKMEIRVKVTHKTLYSNQKNIKIFDSSSFGERRDIDEGELCKVDDMRADSNINFQDFDNPYIHKLHNQFKNILEKVLQS